MKVQTLRGAKYPAVFKKLKSFENWPQRMNLVVKECSSITLQIRALSSRSLIQAPNCNHSGSPQIHFLDPNTIIPSKKYNNLGLTLKIGGWDLELGLKFGTGIWFGLKFRTGVCNWIWGMDLELIGNGFWTWVWIRIWGTGFGTGGWKFELGMRFGTVG